MRQKQGSLIVDGWTNDPSKIPVPLNGRVYVVFVTDQLLERPSHYDRCFLSKHGAVLGAHSFEKYHVDAHTNEVAGVVAAVPYQFAASACQARVFEDAHLSAAGVIDAGPNQIGHPVEGVANAGGAVRVGRERTWVHAYVR